MAVRLAAAGYLLYRLWIVLFRGRVAEFWKRIPVREKKKPSKASEPIRHIPGPVVGATNVIILDDPKAGPPVVATTELEPTGFIGSDEPIDPDDIEVNQVELPTDEELYADNPADPDLSSGLTFDQIGEAVNVLTETVTDEDARTRAAGTLYKLQNTDIFDFITSEVSDAVTIEALIKDCLDDAGEPLPGKVGRIEDVRLKGFDIDKYV
ncbi:DUF4122 domain-containing protein [Alistipes sp. OttesenSCG-928-L06]|nr:DUF4122 domain-containing protein [Alistipes sp. OttesenSCG-928-L06]